MFEHARERRANECAADADAVLSTYQQRVDELITAVRRAAAELFDVSFRQDIERDAFAIGEEPYWVTEDIVSTLIPDPGRVLDRLLPSQLRRAHLRRRLIRETEQLIVRNAENLRWAILRGFDETFRNATGHLDERLDDAITATQKVIKDALAKRRDRSFAVDPEIGRLAGVLSSLTDIREALSRDGVGGLIHGEPCRTPNDLA